jgi:hypothetical protein
LAILAITAFTLWYLWPRTDETRVLGPFVLLGAPKENERIGNGLVPIFSQAQMNRSLKNNFTFSFFVYMDKINSERIPFAGPKGEYRFKPLIKILGFGEFVLNPVHQSALLRTTPALPLVINDTFIPPHNVELENILNDRWNQITISLEGRSIDIYLNGTHATSLQMQNVATSIPTGVFLETSPDFWGQAALMQAWPRRLAEEEILKNYLRNTDKRGKPLVPDKVDYTNIWAEMRALICRTGMCPDFGPSVSGLEYIDYEYA